jgi:hypothetical protein
VGPRAGLIYGCKVTILDLTVRHKGQFTGIKINRKVVIVLVRSGFKWTVMRSSVYLERCPERLVFVKVEIFLGYLRDWKCKVLLRPVCTLQKYYIRPKLKR